jgi:hypothetical protein
MCIHYMRLLEEEDMITLSTFVNGDLRADTFRKDGHYGAIFYDKYGEKISEELYTGHSEIYAEDAAENYVFGIKKIGVQ